MYPQTRKVLSHLLNVGNLSGIEAAALYKVRNLPRRICDLKEAGFNVDGEWKTDATGQRYKRYRLHAHEESSARSA